MKNTNNKGITLVELIVSFALIGVAIIYFFQTLYTVKKVYTNARNETNNYLNVNYDLRILDEHYDLREKQYSNICKNYNLSCNEVKFAGYFSDKDLSDEKYGEDGNDAAKKAIKEGTMKGYKLKVIYPNGKFYYLYKTFKKLNNDGTALMLPYFPGSFGTITGNQNGKYSSRRRVVEAKGVGTVANYSFFKEYTTDYSAPNKPGIKIDFSLATNCDHAINKTTFIFGGTQLEVTYNGKNWDDANIYENYGKTSESFHERGNPILNGKYVDPVNSIVYNSITYDGHHNFRYLDQDGNIISEDEAIKRHSTFSVGGKSLRLSATFSTITKITDKLKVKVELIAENGYNLPSSCSAYTSVIQFGTVEFF